MMRMRAMAALLLVAAGCGRVGVGSAPRPAGAGEAALFTFAPVPERPDAELQRRLEAAVAGFGGEVGIYARHLPTGATAAIRADELFPTASMIKVPLLVKLYDEVERGRLDPEQEMVFADSLRYADYDLSAKFRDGEKIPLEELAFLMVSLSDNTASLWIQALVGGGEAVNRWLEANGYQGTRVNSRTPGRRGDWEVYGWGQTTPREIARLLTDIRAGAVVSPAASERMYRLLSKSYWDREALSALPLGVAAASKQGAVDRSRSEVLLVDSPSGPYVLSVITRDQQDTSYEPDNEGFRLIREVSDVVYRHFAAK